MKNDTISIEWIENRIVVLNARLKEDKKHGGGQMVKFTEWEIATLKDLIKDWRKENATEIRLSKKYPHIKNEDVTSIFLEGYINGFKNGKKAEIPIDWINKWLSKFYKEINGRTFYMGDGYDSVQDMLEDWEKENDQF